MTLRTSVLVLVGVVGLGVAAYYQGKADGRADERLEQLAQQRDTLTHQLDTAAKRVDSATHVAAVAHRAAQRAAAARDTARAAIAIVSDSAVSIDGAAPVPVPAAVIRVLRLDDVALPAGLADANAQMLRANSLAIQLDIEHRLRLNAETRVEILEDRAHPLCGRKCGAALGAGAVLLVLLAGA